MSKSNLAAISIAVGIIATQILATIGILYIAIHFISKFW